MKTMINDEDDNFFDHISEVTGDEANELMKPITLEELRTVLKSCKDSAPGPDGIPYSILCYLWPLIGDMILRAWNHSVVSGELPISHRMSFLKLIPKAGKDLKLLTNWRPITLSNCDHKLITMCFAICMSNI